MNSWTIKPVFDRRHTGSPDRRAKVEIVIYFSRTERSFIPTDIEAYADGHWDSDAAAFVGTPDARSLNSRIRTACRKYDDMLKKIVRDGCTPNRATLKQRIDAERNRHTADFYTFAIGELGKRDICPATRRAHLMSLDALRRSGCVRTFDDISSDSIQAFDDFLRREDPSRTQVTLHNYHKRIKPYILIALERGLIGENPYERFRDRRGKNAERHPLSQHELDTIRALDIPDRSTANARDLFVFCCYTGLAYADLAQFVFDRDTIPVGDMYYIDGHRVKTGSAYYTPILAPAMDVLRRHDYRLRVPTNQAYNRALKAIAISLGMKHPLTSHIARHTFATTVVLAHDIPIESLMKMLGHQKISVTQIYAKVLNSSVERNGSKLNELL